MWGTALLENCFMMHNGWENDLLFTIHTYIVINWVLYFVRFHFCFVKYNSIICIIFFFFCMLSLDEFMIF